jgi:hypothetical protein
MALLLGTGLSPQGFVPKELMLIKHFAVRTGMQINDCVVAMVITQQLTRVKLEALQTKNIIFFNSFLFCTAVQIFLPIQPRE